MEPRVDDAACFANATIISETFSTAILTTDVARIKWVVESQGTAPTDEAHIGVIPVEGRQIICPVLLNLL